MAKRKKGKSAIAPIPSIIDIDTSIPHYTGTVNQYVVEPRLSNTDDAIISGVEAIPFIGRAISDLFFGETKRRQKLDQIASAKVDQRRVELDRISPRAAYSLGESFYDNAYARERNLIANRR